MDNILHSFHRMSRISTTSDVIFWVIWQFPDAIGLFSPIKFDPEKRVDGRCDM